MYRVACVVCGASRIAYRLSCVSRIAFDGRIAWVLASVFVLVLVLFLVLVLAWVLAMFGWLCCVLMWQCINASRYQYVDVSWCQCPFVRIVGVLHSAMCWDAILNHLM